MITANERNQHEKENREERARCFRELDVDGFRKAFPNEPRRISNSEAYGKPIETVHLAELHAARLMGTVASGKLSRESELWLCRMGFQAHRVGGHNPTTDIAWRD